MIGVYSIRQEFHSAIHVKTDLSLESHTEGMVRPINVPDLIRHMNVVDHK